MFDLHSRTLTVKIVLGVVLGMVSIGMLLYLVPMPNTPLSSGTGGLANVDGLKITVGDVQHRLDLMAQQEQIPPQMRGLYVHQILDQMIFSRLLEVESSRLGIGVSDHEVARQIRLILPTAFPKGKWIGAQAYSTMVEQDFGLTVPQFESEVRQGILEQKFRDLVTAGVFITPQDVHQEFLRQHEKVKIDYVQIDPSVLAAKIRPTPSELQAWYGAHKQKYQVPEKRSARYLLLNTSLLAKNTVIPDQQLQAYYTSHIDQYKVPERVHVEHILFMTVGKPTAEIALIRKEAQKVLEMVRHGGNFAKLAEKYSEDPGSKSKGGNLGWIVRGQTVPAFQKVAFSLPVGQVSGLVKTQYGFHIIKVLGRQMAHTKSFQQVRGQILQTLLVQKVQQETEQISDNMSNIVGQSTRQSLQAVANDLGPQAKASLVMGQIPPVSVTQPIPGFGNSNSVRNALFAQSIGQLSLPIDTSQGYLILEVNQIVPTHQGTFKEVLGRVQSDYIRAQSADLARQDARKVVAALKQGKALKQAAQALGFQVQSAEFSRTGSVSGVPARQFLAAFSAPVGQPQGPRQVNGQWYVYAVTAHEKPSEASFKKQSRSIRQELLSTARNSAFDAFRRALEKQMEKQGKLSINNQNLKQLTSPSQT